MNDVVDIKSRIYEMRVQCWNCDTTFVAQIPKGTRFDLWDGGCPDCGCSKCFHRLSSAMAALQNVGTPLPGPTQYPPGSLSDWAEKERRTLDEMQKQKEMQKLFEQASSAKLNPQPFAYPTKDKNE